MAVDIKVPGVGESVTEGRIARWLKKAGESVKEGDVLFELETDKATAEVAAPATGVLTITSPDGTMVQVGSSVGSIDPAGKPTVQSAPKSSAPAATAPSVPSVPMAEPVDGPALSPAARRVVAEQNLDPAKLTGTGRGGVVTKEDALRPAAKTNGTPAPAPVSPPAPVSAPVSTGERTTRMPMSMIRKSIARRLLESQQTTASLTTFNEVDMTSVMELRAAYKDKFKEKHKVNLGFMCFFAKAVVEALKAFPMVNGRIDGDQIVMQHFYDIGVAVSTERGLMVPVIRNVDTLSYAGIEAAINDVALRARDGKISTNDMSGGTFTITNGGTFGSMLSTPILNPPQVGILGMHNIVKRAVVVNDQIVIRSMMYVALTYDHRLIDGREAVQFLVRVKDCIENPERMLLNV